MDALQLLTADHNRFRGMFERFEAAKEDDDLDAMHALAGQIFAELDVHTTIEEDVFYPAVRDLDEEVRELVVEGLEEHHVAGTVMEEARRLDPADEHWAAKLTVLIESVQHHAEEEESELFARLREVADAEALEALGARLEARKRELGAPTVADTIDLTKEELLERARAQAIPGRSKMGKEELAATVAP